MKRVAVLQSNYLPWKGYFDIIGNVDLFVFHDDLQYTKNDWRNRNRIKTARGLEWITIPVGTDEHRLICDVEIKESAWQKKHWNMIKANYGSAPCYNHCAGFLQDIFLGRTWSNLSELNQYLVRTIARDFLGIQTEFADSRAYAPVGAKQERLIDLLRKVDATCYLSGPAGRDYIDPVDFVNAGIELVWQSYAGYPQYPQLFPPFEHAVSIIDLLFGVGRDAHEYIWGWRDK